MSWFQTASQSAKGLAPSSLAQWAGAIATSLAVLVALFRDSILSHWRKPRLGARCSKDSPWTVRTKIIVYSDDPQTNTRKILWSGDCYYVRIEVENTGRTRAEKVQVYASKLERVALDGTREPCNEFIPLNMRWSNSPPSAPTLVLDGISPEMGAFCDVISLCDPANPHQGRPTGTKKDVTIGQLQLEVEPTNESHLLSPDEYRLTLRIAAANAKPIKKVLTFKHTGRFLPDDKEMRRECLVVALE